MAAPDVQRPRLLTEGSGLRRLAVALLAALLLSGCAAQDGSAPDSAAARRSSADRDRGSQWTQFGYDLRNSSYNPEESVLTASTAARLQTKWSFPVDEAASSRLPNNKS